MRHVHLGEVIFAVAALSALGDRWPTSAHAICDTCEDKFRERDVESWATLDGPVCTRPNGRGDRFLNFDANWYESGQKETGGKAQVSRQNTSMALDWPVNLVFVSRDRTKISTSKVKRILETASPRFDAAGGPMHLYLEHERQGKWDEDRGAKLFPATCDEDGKEVEDDVNYHFRVYGPDGEGVLSHPDHGYFVVATSHIDFREGCKGSEWFGESEQAEAFIAEQFAKRDLWVERNKIPLGNALNHGHDQSDGRATVIHLDESGAGKSSDVLSDGTGTLCPGMSATPGGSPAPPAPRDPVWPPRTTQHPPRNGCVFVQYCDFPNEPGTVCRTYPGCAMDDAAVTECRQDTRAVCGIPTAPHLLCDMDSSGCRGL